jgi:hypothetical protein
MNSSGCSTWGRWPARGIVTSCAFGSDRSDDGPQWPPLEDRAYDRRHRGRRAAVDEDQPEASLR